MQITKLVIRNFRTLEKVDIDFPSFYTAVCGRNNSGKTNVIRAIRGLMKENEEPFDFDEEEEFSLKDDFPKWKEVDAQQRQISVGMELVVDENKDAGLYQFLKTYLALEKIEQALRFTVTATYPGEQQKPKVEVKVNGQVFDGFKAQDVLDKLQSSRIILFHNSTGPYSRIRFSRGVVGLARDLSEEYQGQIAAMKQSVNRGLKKIAKSQQKEIEELLGRFEDKYKVGLSLPPFDFDYVPFSITLGDKKVEVPLDDWGSGTRNRTLILVMLLRARRISESTASAAKITPIIVVEEPESFLHPAAQAEFARLLQDLAEEFQIQVITTTHSPYMLGQRKPEANILLERHVVRNQLRDTYRVDTSGENWVEPFGLALGINNMQFAPWRELFFGAGDNTLLVEGDTDKEYFELLLDSQHGENRLQNVQEIFPYGGCDNLRNTVLLRFIKNRCRKVFVTYDLDAVNNVEASLTALGLVKGRHFCPIGQDEPGKRNIEGIVPEGIRGSVYSANPELVQQAMYGLSAEQKSAKQKLKRLILDEFKAKAKPGDENFKPFYGLVRIINRGVTRRAILIRSASAR